MTQGIPATEAGPDMDREAKIRELAYIKWADAGEPDGDGAEFWLAAERELARREPQSGDGAAHSLRERENRRRDGAPVL
jgi:hypothetical protein